MAEPAARPVPAVKALPHCCPVCKDSTSSLVAGRPAAGKLCASCSVTSAEVFLLRRWFYSAETPDARIAVVGHQGAGVSSVVNSWYSALGSRIHEISLCSDGAQACTKQLAVRQLTPRICISELWGWNGVNYKRDELQLCLSGLLVNGTASSLGERERVDRLLYSLRPEERAWQHRSDVVVVVVDFTKQSTFDVAVPFLQVIRGAGARPMVAVTHIDSAIPAFRSFGEKLAACTRLEVEKALSKVAASLKLDRHHVWPALPYCREPSKLGHIDAINLRLLKRAVEMSVDVRADRAADGRGY